MRKAFIVARWEFLSTVTRRAYVIAVIAMPLVFTIVMTLPILSGRSAMRNSVGRPIALVDPAGLVDVGFANETAARRRAGPTVDVSPGPAAPMVSVNPILTFDTLDAALEELKSGRVSGVYELADDYLQSGRVTAYQREAGLMSQAFAGQRQTQISDAIRASLLRTELPSDRLARAYAPLVRMERRLMGADGAVKPVDDALGLGPFFGPFAILMLMTMAVFFSAGFLQQATVEDRQNRVIEILLSSTSPNELLMGKIAGLGAAGLLQVGIYVLIVIIPGTTIFSLFRVPIPPLLLSVVYFVIGYLLFASLMAGTGMIGRTPQESAQLSAIWSLTAASPLFFIASVGSNPNGLLSRFLSFFPLTSPVTMMLRLTTGVVPIGDIILSLLIGAVSVYIALRGAAKIFRAASLMYGKRATLPEVIRWLRAS